MDRLRSDCGVGAGILKRDPTESDLGKDKLRKLYRGNRRNLRRTALAKLGLAPDYRKVFAIGFNRTATTSIHAVFRACGLVSTHDTIWRNSRLPFYHWLFQGFSDGPPDSFETLDQRFRRSRFILNTRDLTEWLDSRLLLAADRKDTGIPTLMTFVDDPERAVLEWVMERNRYHAAVLRYFADRPDDLLVLNYIRDPDAATKIATFIGQQRQLDRLNASSFDTRRVAGTLRYGDLIETGLSELGIARSEWNNDLLCSALGDVAGLPLDTRDIGLSGLSAASRKL